jgi:hypothetical protein
VGPPRREEEEGRGRAYAKGRSWSICGVLRAILDRPSRSALLSGSGGPDLLDPMGHRLDEILHQADDLVGRTVGMGFQEIADVTTNEQLERLLELPLSTSRRVAAAMSIRFRSSAAGSGLFAIISEVVLGDVDEVSLCEIRKLLARRCCLIT